MNRLQKRAWGELAGMVACVIIAGAAFSAMVQRNVHGPGMMLVCLVSACVSGLVSATINIKSLKKYDEREKKIYQQAFVISTYAFVGYILCFVFITFFSIGGAGDVPVSMLPIMLLGGLFVSQTVQSGVILFRCAMEEDDG